MELFTILLSGFLSLLTPLGFIVDKTAATAIRSQFKQVEQLQVRIDNPPTQQLLQGKVKRVRIAGRNLLLKQQDFRLAALELETDPIHLEPRSIRRGKVKLKQPLQAGIRVVVTQNDLNKALQSPELLARLRKINIGTLGGVLQSYDFVNPQIKFLANHRLNFQVEIREPGNNQPLLIGVESGLQVLQGRQIQLVEPVVTVNGELVPPQFVKSITNNLNKQLDLQNLETYGVRSRILKLEVRQEQLEVTTFVHIDPSAPIWKTR